jgi:hypothetical protein
MCEIGPINQQQGLKYDQEFGITLSILAAIGISISASQKEQILTAVKNLSASPEVIEKQDFHKLHPQEYLEAFFGHPFQPIEETKESFNGEKLLEPEIEESLACFLADHVCTPKNNHLEEDNMHSMVEEDIQCDLNKEEKQEYSDPIEIWFQLVIRSHHSYIFHYCLISSSKKLVLHTLVCIKIYFLNPSMDIFLTLLRTWLHWKYSYT